MIKMLSGLIYLSWFDTITVVGTFLTVIIVQLLNAGNKSEKKFPTTRNVNEINGQLMQKRFSALSDDVITNTPPSSSATSTTSENPTTHIATTNTARHSLSSLHSGGSSGNLTQSSHPPLNSSESLLTDEYHEDEDTLSLDNLFPCDQTEIYASKKISFIIDELIQTEMNYVNNLRKGLENYGKLHKRRQDLPEALQGSDKQQQLLGNIAEILELHEKQILPLMIRNQRDLKLLFDEFAAHFDKDNFYAYVIFMMNKKTSMQLRQEHREWFQSYEKEIKDKLGIDSFLVQPIQRLTRYPLLLQQFISEFYKSGISCKPVLVSVCKLETRMRRMLEVVNQAEEIPTIDDINELNPNQQGRFRRSTEFEAYHYRTRKKYRAKVFLFDRCLFCAEVRKKRLVYKQHLPWDTIDLQLNNSKSILVLQKASGSGGTPTNENSNTSHNSNNSNGNREEYELSSPEAITVNQWMRCARKIIEISRFEEYDRGTFSLPMDLVLGVAIAIWLIWNYLY